MSRPSVPDYYVGLMSGTSVDGIDAVLVNFSSDKPELVATCSSPWPRSVRDAIFATRHLADNKLNNLQNLDIETGILFAEAVKHLLTHANVDSGMVHAIGSHGQTIRHRPQASPPFSLQIGNPLHIALETGIQVVSDFRTADIEAGGQGAPLVPGFHQFVFQNEQKNRVIVNIGGIANITCLPADKSRPVTGFDTGPGNNLMDAWVKQKQQEPYDREGKLASTGKTNANLLANMLMDNYFQQPPPKSTGFEKFDLEWLQQHLNQLSIHPADEDIQSTLCDLTATSIIRAINQYARDCDEIYICGGGAHNTELMRRIQSLTPLPVATTETIGVHPDWVEAMTFAWLAKQRLNNQPGNIPEVTGASKAVILGNVTTPAAYKLNAC